MPFYKFNNVYRSGSDDFFLLESLSFLLVTEICSFPNVLFFLFYPRIFAQIVLFAWNALLNLICQTPLKIIFKKHLPCNIPRGITSHRLPGTLHRSPLSHLGKGNYILSFLTYQVSAFISVSSLVSTLPHRT